MADYVRVAGTGDVTLAVTIGLAAERYPAMEAVVAGARRLSYRQWSARINRAARGLARLGIRPGDHVAMLLKNREEHATLYWACQALGAIATPLNWRYSAGVIEYCGRDAEAMAVMFEQASRDAALVARAALPGVPAWIAVGEGAPAGCVAFEALAGGDDDPGAPTVAVTESDVSIMLYTSGTTGRPKGVPRSHRNERSAAWPPACSGRWGTLRPPPPLNAPLFGNGKGRTFGRSSNPHCGG